MKRIIAVFLLFAIAITCCACGSNKAKMVEKFLKGFFGGDFTALKSSVPSELYSYFRNGTERAHYYQGTSLSKLSVEEDVKLDDGEIDKVIAEYLSETGVRLDIDEAYVFQWKVTLRAVDGDKRTEDSDRFEMLAVKIDGKWYAIPRSL